MTKKAFNHTAFFKNAKRVIQREKNGAYVLTGYTGRDRKSTRLNSSHAQ